VIERLKDIIEALIFISIEPLGFEQLKLILQEFAPADIERALEDLLRDQESGRGGIRVQMTAGGYIFATRPDFDSWVRRLLSIERKTKLSMASLETLSTVAYHQPITQAEISALRGVDATYTLKTLLHKKLIKIAGRKKAPGSPLIYRTTDKFLEYFGLNGLEDLPKEEEISKLLEADRMEPLEDEPADREFDLAAPAAQAAAETNTIVPEEAPVPSEDSAPETPLPSGKGQDADDRPPGETPDGKS
jgi:segregation and condensation protein B